MEKIKVLVVKPFTEPEEVMIENELHDMQSVVGGYIEMIPYKDVFIVCNEEGKLIGLPFNRKISKYDAIMGNFFICSADGAEFASLTDEQITRYKKVFAI
jgi:hypothetical protein